MSSQVETLLGRRIRSRRRMLGLTQQTLGDRVGVTPQMVHKWETAQCALYADTLFRLSHAMDVPPDYFFSEAD